MDDPRSSATSPPPDALATILPLDDVFADVTADVGLDFVHANGMSGEFFMPENMGAGGALVDYDDDGDLDLYLVQGGRLEPDTGAGRQDRLYKNELTELGHLRFTDVTAEAGLAPHPGYGMGVASGDYDNNGRADLYVTALGPNLLLENRGDGTFEDVTEKAGVDDVRWSVPAVFFDYDGDGWLDLYVGNYLDFTFGRHRPCVTKAGARDYCDPEVYEGVPDRLFRNRGDGTFEDATASSGLDAAYGKALGAVAADLDGDGRLDLYVANDGTPNLLWLGRDGGTFVEEALFGGCALNGEGLAEASMGVDAGDYDGDGDLDLFMTHFHGQTHTLYQNDGHGFFEDVTFAAGLGAPTLEATGFGTRFVDVDLDGVLDLLAVNGAVRSIEALAQAGDPYPYHQPNQLFRGLGDGRFEEIDGGVLARSEVSRGAVFGDLDNDGDVDVVVTNNNAPARVWLSSAGQDRGWVGLRLVVGGDQPRDALGARVELLPSGKAPIVRRVGTDGGYASANDPRVVFVLEGAGAADVRVVWPDGTVETRGDAVPGRYSLIQRQPQK